MAPPSTQPSPSSPAPRSFPPPALADVPLEYIVDQLHNLAPRYWNKLDTTDCMIGMSFTFSSFPFNAHASSHSLASPFRTTGSVVG